MTIIADRGLFPRVLTASGKVRSGEAEALADAVVATTKNPDTKADAVGVKTGLAAMNERFEAQADKLPVRLGGVMIAVGGLLFAALRSTAP